MSATNGVSRRTLPPRWSKTKAVALKGSMRLPAADRLELLIAVTCLAAILGMTGCDRESKSPPAQKVAPAQQIVGTGPDVSFRLFRWEKGLNLLLVDDIHQGDREHESSTGSADNPVRTHRGSTSTADGQGYTWQLETTNGQTAKFAIERKEYDLSKGALFVVKTKGKTVQVLQLDRPLAGVPFDVDGCRDYLKKQGEVMEFLEAGGLRIQELESSEELFGLVGQKALVFKFTGGDVEFWIELDSDGKKQIHGVCPYPRALSCRFHKFWPPLFREFWPPRGRDFR